MRVSILALGVAVFVVLLLAIQYVGAAPSPP
jgi:hypothetical protein